MNASKVFRVPLLVIGMIFVFSHAQAAVISVPADYSTIQAAINAGSSGDTVRVAPGIYYENVTMKNGVDLIGAGPDVTIIDGGGNGDVVDAGVIGATISGFTLRNSGPSDTGRGIKINGPYSPSVRNNVIVGNNFGVGVWYGANPDIRNNIIMDNFDGLYVYGSVESPSNPAIVNNTIVNNERGGITLRMEVSPVILNNIITGHVGTWWDGNTWRDCWGIHYNIVTGTPALSYNDLWNNDVNYMRNFEADETLDGTGAISDDPLFVDPAAGNYRLGPGSPCIDAGDPDSIYNDRNGSRNDMGAYGGPYACTLVAYYPFNGNANDESGNGNHGTEHGGLGYVDGLCEGGGQAAVFYGVDGYVELPNESNFDLTALTIAATIKVPSVKQENYIISKGIFGNFTLRIRPSDHEHFPGWAEYVHDIYPGGNWCSAASDGPVPVNEFFHIAVTMESSGLFKAYINGQLAFSAAVLDPPVLNDTNVTIGRGCDDYFVGVIDDLRIYNYALSETEIKELVDSDCDGVPNYRDNCPERENSDQLNSDTDAFGDECDFCPKVANDDVNGDGFADPCGIETGSGTTDASGTLVTVTFTYKGPDVYWILPDCKNVIFIPDKPIPMKCWRGPPYKLTVFEEEVEGWGKPGGDWYPVTAGDSKTITCDLLKIFDEQSLVAAGTITFTPMYTCYSRDRGSIMVDTNKYTLFYGSILAETITRTSFREVEIDIKPGSFPNSINLGSGGVVPVAILSSDSFDATKVKPLSVQLEGAGVRVKGKGMGVASYEDVNGDGRADIVVHVETQALHLQAEDTRAKVDGNTDDGTGFYGYDSIRVVP